MKKIFFTFVFIIILIILFLFINQTHSPNVEQLNNNIPEEVINKNTVSYNGWLHTNGAIL